MTDEEFAKVYEEFLAHYDDQVPNPEQEPIRFAAYVRNWKYYKERLDINSKV